MKPKTIDAAPARRKPIRLVDLSTYPPDQLSHCPPQTGVGCGFWACYLDALGLLGIVVKCNFEFIQGYRDALDPDPSDPKNLPLTAPPQWIRQTAPPWTDAEMKAWKTAFLEKNSKYWSGYFAFACTTPGSEALFAETEVQFVDAGQKGDHIYNVKVYRWSHPDFSGGSVVPTCNVRGSTVQLAEEARDEITIIHEAGHMLGLGDEYPRDDGKPEKADHSDLVYDDFGHEVWRGQVETYRLMYSRGTGWDVVREYGVVFAHALRTVTQMEWKHIT